MPANRTHVFGVANHLQEVLFDRLCEIWDLWDSLLWGGALSEPNPCSAKTQKVTSFGLAQLGLVGLVSKDWFSIWALASELDGCIAGVSMKVSLPQRVSFMLPCSKRACYIAHIFTTTFKFCKS